MSPPSPPWRPESAPDSSASANGKAAFGATGSVGEGLRLPYRSTKLFKKSPTSPLAPPVGDAGDDTSSDSSTKEAATRGLFC